MGTKTAIEWTDHTFNPWIECTRVSEGCRNCYAEKLATTRMGRKWGPGAERRRTSEANWKEPVRWAKEARRFGRRDKVFCASLADVFDFEAHIEARRDLWKLIGDTCDSLDWQLLTKRPDRITSVMCDDGLNLGFFELAHCWLGTSVEDQKNAWRIKALCENDAAVKFISAEPLIGPLEIETALKVFGVDWLICGGESGAQARIMKPEWARSLRDQCAGAGVAFFMKQGSKTNWKDFKNFDALPEDLQIREYPDGKR